MASFPQFQALPAELRIEIWRQHFAACHGRQIHVFHSASPDADMSQTSCPKYANLDAATNLPGYDTLGAAGVSPEAWSVFKESFHIGDTKCLLPQSALQDSSGRLVDYDPRNEQSDSPDRSMRALYAAAAQQELRRQCVRFAIDGENDIVYIVDKKVQPISQALFGTSWMQNVRRLAFQILNFQGPQFSSRAGRWAQWDNLSEDPPPGMREFFSNPAFEELLLVMVPNLESQRSSLLQHADAYGLVPATEVDFAELRLGTDDEAFAFRGHTRIITGRLIRNYPRLSLDNKLRYVADAIPSRARFSINP
jgi:hypothetical protein